MPAIPGGFMIKRDEVDRGCMAKALPNEMTFVLLARDKTAPTAVIAWAVVRVVTFKNWPWDAQIREAFGCAREMIRQREDVRRELAKPPPGYSLGCDGDPFFGG